MEVRNFGNLPEGFQRVELLKFAHELPIKIPARNTSAPPSATWNNADAHGVSMNRWRIHEMMPSSTSTTHTATATAVFKFGIKNGSVWPRPPSVVINPHTKPRAHGWPRPVRLPSSDNASAKPMLMPA